MKKQKESIIDNIIGKTPVQIFIRIVSLIAFIVIIRWLGIRGMTGFMLGVITTTYAIYTTNVHVRSVLAYVEGKLDKNTKASYEVDKKIERYKK